VVEYGRIVIIMLDINALENNLERIHGWIKSVDQKVSIFLAFQGVVIGLLFKDVFKWASINLHSLNFFTLFLFCGGVVLIVCSVLLLTTAILPKLDSNSKSISLLYFRDIAKTTLSDFKKNINSADQSSYREELINQIHISSIISLRKHEQLREAIILFVIAIGLFMSTYILSTLI
jgi:hypothetical protein